jgi:hypothetical protein
LGTPHTFTASGIAVDCRTIVPIVLLAKPANTGKQLRQLFDTARHASFYTVKIAKDERREMAELNPPIGEVIPSTF